MTWESQVPKDKGPCPHAEGYKQLKSSKFLPLISKCLGRYFPSQGLTYLANGFSLLIGDSWQIESVCACICIFRRPGG